MLPCPPELPPNHPCVRAQRLQAALDALAMGQVEAQVRNGEEWLTFQKGDAKLLQTQLLQAQRDCSVLMGRSATCSPGYSPVPNGGWLGWPYGPYGY